MVVRPTVGLCAIVKNEERNLPRCLDSVKDWVDELVVVDTGSTDRTVAIAEGYGARVGYFAWIDDFAAARNAALALATQDWVLVLDADEVLVVRDEGWRERLGVLPESIWACALDWFNVGAEREVGGTYLRLFRNSSTLRFVGAFHETIAHQGAPLPETAVVDFWEVLAIAHSGHTPEALAWKNRERNIPLLEKQRAAGTLDLYLLYALAEAYGASDRPEAAQSCYEEAWQRLEPYLLADTPPADGRAVPSWLHNLGMAALAAEDWDTLTAIVAQGNAWYPDFPPLLHLAGVTAATLGFPLGAVPYFERCLQLGQTGGFYRREPFRVEWMTVRAAYNLGCAYQALGDLATAQNLFAQALAWDANFQPARDRLAELASTENPARVDVGSGSPTGA
ncbi:MAG: glycosyltransferase [Pseudanabaenaceae cyanobacterium]